MLLDKQATSITVSEKLDQAGISGNMAHPQHPHALNSVNGFENATISDQKIANFSIGILIAITGFFLVNFYISTNEKIDKLIEDVHLLKKEGSELSIRFTEIEKKDSCELFSLSNDSRVGKFVFYPKNEPAGRHPSQLVCALSKSYDWGCSDKILKKYLNKKVYLSFNDHEDNSREFLVILKC